MFVQISDANLSGYIQFEYDGTPEDLQADLQDWIGTWTYLPNTDGRVLLGEPSAYMFIEEPGEDAYPDYIVTERAVGVA